jgi:alpha-tubulin suppressor-like RCC1 family protein
MTRRTTAAIARLCTVAALLTLGASAVMQVGTAAPVSGTGSFVALLAWGDNSLGQLGDGISGGSSDTPVAVPLPSGVTPVAFAGSGGGGDPQPSQWASYAIGSDGNLYAWGDNSSGELGNGGMTQSDSPVVVSLPAGVTPIAVTAAQGAAYAIGSDGQLYAWGTNFYGNLGDGTTITNSDTPVVVSLPSGVTPLAIAGGYESAYAIGSDGNLYAWGDNVYGELGNGSTTNSDTPVVVSLPSGVTPKTIAGGGGAGYAIGSNGSLYAWGYNIYGQLGDGSTTNSDTPVPVSLPSGVTAKAVTGGGGFAHAIGSDGKLYGWGLDNTANQVGDGSDTNQVTPVVVTLAAGVTPTAVSDDLHTGYAIGSDGNIYAWGYGLAGELGNGGPGNFSPPVVVSLPPESSPESLGQEPGSVDGYAIVDVSDVAPSITTQPVSVSVLAGQGASFDATASGFPAPTVQWEVSTDGGSTFSPLPGATNTTLTLTTTTLAENGYEYEAVFTDGTSPDATTDAAVLTVRPLTQVLQPANNSTLLGSVWLDASGASPLGVQSVHFRLSGGTINEVIGPVSATRYGWLGGFDTTSVPNGTYQLVSELTDTSGTLTTSTPITVTLDNKPLSTTVVLPTSGASVTNGSVLDAGALGLSPMTGVTFEVSGGALDDHVVGTATPTLYGWIALADTTGVPPGSYTLQSVATDTTETATSPGITVNVS